MIKKALALSLLFAVSNTNIVRAEECINEACDIQNQECINSENECPFKQLENAKFLGLNINLEKKDDESWASVVEATHTLLKLLQDTNIDMKETKSHIKKIYKLAEELNLSGSINMTASDKESEPNKDFATLSIEDLLDGTNISISCTIEKNCDGDCPAIENIITHSKAMIKSEKDFPSLSCIEGIFDAAENLTSTISIDVK